MFFDDLPTKPVPVINVLLQPVAQIYPEMAYEQMEIFPSDPARTIVVDMDVTPALIEYLHSQGETEIVVLYRMTKIIEYMPEGDLLDDFQSILTKMREILTKLREMIP